MRALEWLRDPAGQPLKAVYVIYGDDLYLRRESARAIVRADAGRRGGRDGGPPVRGQLREPRRRS